ncbi:MAG: dodecin [Rhodospirillales bacterium]
MSNSVYKKVELVGISPNSISDAINAIAHGAAEEKIQLLEVVEMRGHVEDGKVTQYQVVLKVGYRLLEPEPPPIRNPDQWMLQWN